MEAAKPVAAPAPVAVQPITGGVYYAAPSAASEPPPAPSPVSECPAPSSQRPQEPGVAAAAEPPPPEEFAAPVVLFPCEGCGRKFNEKALARHAKICKKVFQSKRTAFDSRKNRAAEGALDEASKHGTLREIDNHLAENKKRAVAKKAQPAPSPAKAGARDAAAGEVAAAAEVVAVQEVDLAIATFEDKAPARAAKRAPRRSKV